MRIPRVLGQRSDEFGQFPEIIDSGTLGPFAAQVFAQAHEDCPLAWHLTHVECLDRLIRDFIKVRGEAGNGSNSKAKARTTAASP